MNASLVALPLLKKRNQFSISHSPKPNLMILSKPMANQFFQRSAAVFDSAQPLACSFRSAGNAFGFNQGRHAIGDLSVWGFCLDAQMVTVFPVVRLPQSRVISGLFYHVIGLFLIAMNQFQRGGIATAKPSFGQPIATNVRFPNQGDMR